MSIKLIYIAGPYRADTPKGRLHNIIAAKDVGASLMKTLAPALPVVPHITGFIYSGIRQGDDSYWLPATLALMERCDALLMVPGWEASEGSVAERARALELELPVFESVEDAAAWATKEAK